MQILRDRARSSEEEMLEVGLSDLCWWKSPGEPDALEGQSRLPVLYSTSVFYHDYCLEDFLFGGGEADEIHGMKFSRS